jgi:hypothetical protein
MSVSCECCVLSDLGDRPIPRPEESCLLWCSTVYDMETSRMKRSWSAWGCCARGEKLQVISSCYALDIRYNEVRGLESSTNSLF